MTAKEIRECLKDCTSSNVLLCEIAAQLAEANELEQRRLALLEEQQSEFKSILEKVLPIVEQLLKPPDFNFPLPEVIPTARVPVAAFKDGQFTPVSQADGDHVVDEVEPAAAHRAPGTGPKPTVTGTPTAEFWQV